MKNLPSVQQTFIYYKWHDGNENCTSCVARILILLGPKQQVN